MIKRVMLLGVGAAVGWLGHTVFSKGRDEVVVRAEESLRNTLHPENIGRNAGQAAATAVAASARSFAYQLREEVPAWKTLSDTLAGPAPRGQQSRSAQAPSAEQDASRTTIRGSVADDPTVTDSARPAPSPDPRKQS